MTLIEWCQNADGSRGETWEVVSGCTPVSRGCRLCYARRFAEGRGRRFYPDGFGRVRIHPERLEIPLRWRKPRRVFVCSRSDLFHEDVPDVFISFVFQNMVPRHTFLVLTKRPQRMRDFMLTEVQRAKDYADAFKNCPTEAMRNSPAAKWARERADSPLYPNVWLGLSVENQRAAEERIPLLLQTPAAVRFVSCEPLLEGLNLFPYFGLAFPGSPRPPARIDWVIAGGESGPGARPAAIEWFRSLRDQCRAAGVPYFQKQLGSRPMFELGDNTAWHTSGMMLGDGHGGSFRRDADGYRLGFAVRTRDRKGADPSEWPEDLRIREFPEVPGGAS
jgi:protein gp37